MNREMDEFVPLSSELFRSIVQYSTDSVVVVKADVSVRYWNDKAAEEFGFSADNPRTRYLFHQLAPTESHAHAKVTIEKWLASTVGDPHAKGLQIEFEIQTNHAKSKWIELRLGQLRDDYESFAVLWIRDIDQQKKLEHELRHQASTDFLSGLINRREFQRLLECNVASNLCLAMIDIDHFKSINDQHGHAAGDQAIRFVANKLIESFGDCLAVARLGGEEFGVIISSESESDCLGQFDSFRAGIETERFDMSGQSNEKLGLTISIGLALSSQSKFDSTSLIANADSALYESKNSGRNKVTIDSSEQS